MNELMITLKIQKGFIAQSKFSYFNDVLIKYNVFLQAIKFNKSKDRYVILNTTKAYTDYKSRINENTIIMSCIPINDHYCVVKDYKKHHKLNDIIKELMVNCIKEELNIEDVTNNNLNTFTKDVKTVSKWSQFDNVYVWDSETIVNDNDDLQVYAAGIINMGNLVKYTYNKETKE